MKGEGFRCKSFGNGILSLRDERLRLRAAGRGFRV